MKKRYLLPIIILLLLGFGGYWSYNFFKENTSVGREAMDLVPKDAVFVMETDEPIQNWKDISASEPWLFLMKNDYFKGISKSADGLTDLIADNEQLFGDFGSRKVIMSAHVYKPSDYDFLYIIDLENISKAQYVLVKVLEELEGYKITKRQHKEIDVYSLISLKGKETLYLSFVDNLLVCSYTNSLVEKSIEQRAEPQIARSVDFKEVQKKVINDGKFRWYINYAYFDKFMRVYTASNEKYVRELSKSLVFSGFGFDYDTDNTTLKLNGFSTLSETESYLQLLHKGGVAKMEFANYVSKRAAIVTAMNVGDFQDFYEGLNLQMKANEPQKYAEYEKSTKKIERFLKISIKDDFISWIDDELAFVHTQPVGMGEKNEYALFIKAKSGSTAREKLDEIGKKIKRRTPVKFRGIEYKGHTIHFLSVKGLFKLMMGDFFGKIEKPYYTIIDDYVIFSNHPQTIKNIIDDYVAKQTLANDDQYKNFSKQMNANNSMLIYCNMPLAQHGLKEFLDQEALSDVSKNKQYFDAFPHFAFQLSADGDGFDTRILFNYRDTEKLKSIKSDIEQDTKQKILDGNSTEIESGDSALMSIKAIEEAALIQIDELILDDLDAKTQEEFYENGGLKCDFGIKNGQKQGGYLEYSEQGTVITKGAFKDDQKVGIWKFYDEDGNLISKKKF